MEKELTFRENRKWPICLHAKLSV